MRFRSYALAVVAIAVAGLGLSVSRAPAPDWRVVVFLGVLTFLAESVALPNPYGGTVSLAFALHYAAVLIGGPTTGALVALCGTLSPEDVRQHKPLHRIAFNGAQLALSALVGGSVYLALLGTPVVPTANVQVEVGYWLVAAVLAALSQAAVNWILVGVAIHLGEGVPVLVVWRGEFRPHLVSLTALSLLGLVLAQLVTVAGPVAALLLVVPFVVARQTLQVYQQFAKAFRDTVRGLVAVLEAKDPYTRGHSERVAVYSREIARGIGMSASEVHDVELAALLHDIGKVGIAAATLGKPGRLTSDEFNEIQLHPITGASILSDIDFLADVVPLIEAHHERLDGSGYPYGLHGDAVPLEARVLAVADCFDAMTSDRAYRSALTYEVARDELLRGAARRLDSQCVEVLLARVPDGQAQQLLESEMTWGIGE